jgi:hypothetical protein
MLKKEPAVISVIAGFILKFIIESKFYKKRKQLY